VWQKKMVFKATYILTNGTKRGDSGPPGEVRHRKRGESGKLKEDGKHRARTNRRILSLKVDYRETEEPKTKLLSPAHRRLKSRTQREIGKRGVKKSRTHQEPQRDHCGPQIPSSKAGKPPWLLSIPETKVMGNRGRGSVVAKSIIALYAYTLEKEAVLSL